VEFCYQRQKTQPGAHIFWVHGNSNETFKASYIEIGQRAGLKGDDEEERLKGIKLWLESVASGDWIMVIDNLDDLAQNPKKYIPVKRGIILYTTRDRRLIGGYISAGAGVEVAEMTSQEALETFSKLMGASGDTIQVYEKSCRQLLGLLENLPLAIAQAAAYIRETGMKIPEYLQVFTECEHNQHEYLSEALLSAHENEGHASRAAMTTWKITVDKVQHESPVSVRLLGLISFLDPEEIPHELLKDAPFFEDSRSPKIFTDALKWLINFSLLYRLESSNYRVHRLVSLWIRTQIDLKKKLEHLQPAVDVICSYLPSQPEDNLPKCVKLLSHAVVALGHAERQHLESQSRWSLEDNVGRIYLENGQYGKALQWHQRALDGYEKTLGKDHLSTLTTVHSMASVFDSQGDCGKALQWYQRALDGSEKTLGKDHPSTLTTVHSMA